MEYNVIVVSPVKTKVEVKVPAEEANAALTATVAIYRQKADFKGFRKGKAPSSVVESRFRKEIVGEATNELLNVHINEIMGELGKSPLSRIDVDTVELVKDQPVEYAFEFEHAPAFELPTYMGLDVEEEEVVVSESDVAAVIDRIRGNLAELTPLAENRPAKDGEVVSLSFEAFEDGVPVPGVKAENFQLTLGEAQALPEFEALVKTVPSGGQGEGPMTFPADFINQTLAGKSVTMKVAVHVIKEKKLPPLDDAMAQKAGHFESLERMREAINLSYQKSRQDLHKAAAQKKLLDGILAKLDFPLPESLVETHLGQLIDDFVERLERRGKSLESTGKTLEGLRTEFRDQAENIARTQIFLMNVAEKEGLEVEPREMDQYFNQLSQKTNQDVLTLKQYYEQNNLVIPVRDKLLADKAVELIYSKANVKKVPAVESVELAGEAAQAEAGE
ncbi:trigger factor [Desulfovibrio sulfodismutans]|uniref:Trigger factor n=1 Tax=Desulfolutivibrio sulfodismutans TaxID=63561 RepID=A0A7K3NRA5_9BACT|nr:trigger factor [Desulfolutivibrio sulfodismutans]NDY58333.1 trigger factor [Desulfolutivibrio sulfodismutans]QLA11606.1 trigger factor [Desulfolutivibrio sulfodismutans DSM 3696]